MIDMHTHILPGIDDGAEDEAVSLRMLQIAVESGTRYMVATPHAIEGEEWLPSWDEITEKTATLNQIAQENGLDIELYPGAEVALSMDILDRISGPGAYCINGGRYMLVELPAAEVPSYTDEFFFQLQTRGITPILAHPERYPEIAKHPELLQEWIEKGILAQCNAPSLTGRMGKTVMETAQLLVKSSMIHCLGSDAHGHVHRRPILSQVCSELETMIEKDYIDLLLYKNARNIIHSEEAAIPEIEIKKEKSKFSWIRKLINI